MACKVKTNYTKLNVYTARCLHHCPRRICASQLYRNITIENYQFSTTKIRKSHSTALSEKGLHIRLKPCESNNAYGPINEEMGPKNI